MVFISIMVCISLYGQNLYFNTRNDLNPASWSGDTTGNYLTAVSIHNKFVENDVWSQPLSASFQHLGKINSISSFYSAGYRLSGNSYSNTHRIYAGFAYQWILPKTNRLHFGIKGIFDFHRVRWNDISFLPDETRPKTYFLPDLDIGFQYQVVGLTVGLSGKFLFSSSKKIEDETFIQNRRLWHAYVSYAFDIRRKVVISPFALFYFSRSFSFDVGAYVALFDRVSVSYTFDLFSLRHSYYAGVRIYRGLRLGIGVDHSQIYSDINGGLWAGFSF